jgi:hypothetical protein
MESLKIKCPSCGIILEVTNSRNETVKRIVCPYCKKTLAITFHDEENPKPKTDMVALPALFYGQMRIALQEGQNQIPLPETEDLIIKVARLKDGNCKCLVSTKRENAIRLNGEYLLMDDEVALSDGDLLRCGKTVLSFNKPVETSVDNPATPQPTKPKINVDPQKKSHMWVAVAACIAAMVLIAVLWPKEEKAVEKVVPEKKVELKDTFPKALETSGTSTDGRKKGGDNGDVNNGDVNRIKTPVSIDYAKLGDYELEDYARKGDVHAQYELGKRWVNIKDSINIVKGTNYLKLASRNGSSEARRALQNVKSTLRNAANNGNTHAENLLKVINGE